ncbi:MAG TPA: condensation domain-containing protein, partial [Chitinispirillaceae bacterium]|nr:condensation domain-containing protein [Chitinispirillaceae bacterium]
RHEALRMTFTKGKTCLLSRAPEPYWEKSDLGKNIKPEKYLQDITSNLFDKIAPEEGKLIAGHYIKGEFESYLLIAGHHLVLDTVSLQIICHDLNCSLRDENNKFDNFGIASLLSNSNYINNELLDEKEIMFWKNQVCEKTGRLISLKNNGKDSVADRISVSKTVCFKGSANGIDVRSSILSSLSKALYESEQRDNLLVKFEGHGRSGVFEDYDLSRTVGWFTVTFPLLLKITDNEKEAKEWTENYFRNLKYGGATYQQAVEKAGEMLACKASVSMNYLGELKGTANDDPIQIYPEFINDSKVPGLVNKDFEFDTPLDLTAFIDDKGDLHLNAWFSPNRVEKTWVDRLMKLWADILDNNNRITNKTVDNELSHLAGASVCDKEDIESFCPVNSAQEGMLFQCALDDNAEIYSVQINFRLKGLVDTGKLEKAWLLVLQRHENLRSLFPLLLDGNYTRLVLKKCRSTVEIKNLTNLPNDLQQKMKEQISGEQMKRKYDLQRGPLITMNLFSYGEQDHEMSWFFHHILMDGWSAGIIIEEMFKIYEALDKNDKIPLLPIPKETTYNNVNQIHTKDQTSAQLWWKENLSGFKNKTFIADCEISQSTLKTPLKEKVVNADSTSMQALKTLSERNSVSLAHIFQTLWGFIIASENNKTRDVIYGIVSSGRSSKEENIEKTVGLFVETIPFRIRWTGSEKLTDMLQMVRDQAMKRSEHGFLHLADIQKVSELKSALFDNILVFENYPFQTLSVKDSFKITDVTGREWHPYPLSLSIVPGENFYFRFNYRSTLISDEKIDEIAEKWLNIIKLVVSEESLLSSDIEKQISSNQIEERESSGNADELLSRFNETFRPYPSDKSTGDILIYQCRKHPQKKALIASDETVITYAEFERLTSSVAAGLKEIKPGEPVAFAMPRCPEAVIVMAAITRAGGYYLPIDKKNPGSRIKTMLKNADCRAVIYWKDGREWFDIEDLTQFNFLNYDDLEKNDPQNFCNQDIHGDMPAYILYTSGSCGEPKGVLVPHKAILRLVINSDFWDLKAGERCLQAAPLGFDASTLEIWGTLLNGGTLSFVSEEQL